MSWGCPAKSGTRSKPAKSPCRQRNARRCRTNLSPLTSRAARPSNTCGTNASMALHLNLLHEEIFEQRQRQRDPLKIGMMVLGALGALMFAYYLLNAYKALEIRNR